MRAGFNVNEYWLKRGESYAVEKRLSESFHKLQERFLLDVLTESRLPFTRVLELGCGFGRITKLLAEHFPDATIRAVDLSRDQLANARRNCANIPNIQFDEYDFYSVESLPGESYDVVIAIEVFLHHPRAFVAELIRKASAMAPYLIHIDWSEDWAWKVPAHVWVHDYGALYVEAGLEVVTFPLPLKCDGQQQELFIAGKNVPDGLIALEAAWRKTLVPAPVESPVALSDPASREGWLSHLHVAEQEILALVPPGASFILVDDHQWGCGPALADRRVIPFLERDGVWWGPPEDDETGLRELERLRREGAQFMVFAWPSFWWLEHYKKLACELDRLPVALKNERLIAFKLTRPSDEPAVSPPMSRG